MATDNTLLFERLPNPSCWGPPYLSNHIRPKMFCRVYLGQLGSVGCWSTVTYNGSTYAEDEDKYNTFADFFPSVFQLSTVILPDDLAFSNNWLAGCVFYEEKIKRILASVDGNKGGGPDLISPIVLKNCNDFFACPLQQAFNEPIRSWIFPVLKKNFIVPVHKTGIS